MSTRPGDLEPGEGLLDPARSSFDSRMQRGILLPDRNRWIINNQGDPVGDQTLAVSNVVVGLLVPDSAISATCQLTAAAIRWRVAGADPTTAAGFRNDVNDVFSILGRASLLAWRAIREGGVDGALYVCFFG